MEKRKREALVRSIEALAPANRRRARRALLAELSEGAAVHVIQTMHDALSGWPSPTERRRRIRQGQADQRRLKTLKRRVDEIEKDPMVFRTVPVVYYPPGPCQHGRERRHCEWLRTCAWHIAKLSGDRRGYGMKGKVDDLRAAGFKWSADSKRWPPPVEEFCDAEDAMKPSALGRGRPEDDRLNGLVFALIPILGRTSDSKPQGFQVKVGCQMLCRLVDAFLGEQVTCLALQKRWQRVQATLGPNGRKATGGRKSDRI